MILGLHNASGIEGYPTPTQTGFITGGPIAIPEPNRVLVGNGGTISQPSVNVLPDGVAAGPLRAHADFFYFRIWVLPPVLDVQNPKLNTDIPFQIWNAFLVGNTLNVVGVTGDDTGVTLDAVVTEELKPLQLRTYNAVIDETAPIELQVEYEFQFDFGVGVLEFLALLADILPIVPNYPITEEYQWKTNIIPHYEGSESRIALRKRPRRDFVLDIALLDDKDRKLLLDKLYKVGNLNVIAPAFHFQAPSKAVAAAGQSRIYVNTRRADLRAGEKVVIRTKAGEYYLFTINVVAADYIDITTAFANEIPAGSIVCAGAPGRIPNKTQVSMGPLAGASQVRVGLLDPRPQVQYPGSAALPTFNGLPIVLRNPLDQGGTDEAYDSGVEVIDNEVGKPQFYTAWNQSYLEGTRRFLCQSLFDLDEREFWRSFLNYACGMQKPFYASTYRSDLEWDDATDFLPSQITVKGTEYATQYFQAESFRQLQIECSAGTFEVKVSNITNNGDSVTINFVDPIAADLTDATVDRVSFLHLLRLGSDKVSFIHYGTYSVVELEIRAVSDADV